MANNREERRSGKDWLTLEQRMIKRSNIKDNFMIFILIISILTNVTLAYSVINLNAYVTEFISQVLGYSPVLDGNLLNGTGTINGTTTTVPSTTTTQPAAPTISNPAAGTTQTPQFDWFGKPVTETPSTTTPSTTTTP